MSKNITIQEGGTGKSMTVHKLKTTLVAGGTCLWVPEDEVSLGTKHITENGTYTASEDGKYGYSQVTVNVPGGAGSADSSGKPTGTTQPGGAGSAVMGNGEDGNEQVVGVDENGDLVNTLIPSAIELVTNPTKTIYSDGDTVDLTGAIAIAKLADGTTWTDETHPNGQIQASELVANPSTINASEIESKNWSGDGIRAVLATSNGEALHRYSGSRPIATEAWRCDVAPYIALYRENATIMLTTYGDSIYVAGYSGRIRILSTTSGDNLMGSSFDFNTNNNFKYLTLKVVAHEGTGIPESTSDPNGTSTEDLTQDVSAQDISVGWARPADNKMLTTVLQVSVTAAQTGGETGGEETGGDEGGGGGGHSF